jgi:hypothetical protein
VRQALPLDFACIFGGVRSRHSLDSLDRRLNGQTGFALYPTRVDRLERQTEWRPCQRKRLNRNRKFGKVRKCRDSWNKVARQLAVLLEVASVGKFFAEECGFMRFDVFAPFASTCGWLENRDWRSPYGCASRHQSTGIQGRPEFARILASAHHIAPPSGSVSARPGGDERPLPLRVTERRHGGDGAGRNATNDRRDAGGHLAAKVR